MDSRKLAISILNEAENSFLFRQHKEFDVGTESYRLYGCIKTYGDYGKVVLIKNIYLEPSLQRQGLFNAIVHEAKRRFRLPVVIAKVSNKSWRSHLQQSDNWSQVSPEYSFLQEFSND